MSRKEQFSVDEVPRDTNGKPFWCRRVQEEHRKDGVQEAARHFKPQESFLENLWGFGRRDECWTGCGGHRRIDQGPIKGRQEI